MPKNIAIRISSSTLQPWHLQCIGKLQQLAGAVVDVVVTPSGSVANWPDALGVPVFCRESEAEVSNTMHARGLLVVLDLGNRPDPKRWARFGQIGCWWFRYDGSEALTEVGVAALWVGRRSLKTELLQSAPDGAVTLVESGHIKVVGHSLAATRNRLFDTVAHWPATALYRYGLGIARTNPGKPDHVATPISQWQRLLLPAALVRNAMLRILREGREEHWTIGMVAGDVGNVASSFDPRSVKWLPELPGGYLADPFAINIDGETVIFAEAYRFDERQGFIIALRLYSDGTMSVPQEVLRLPYHCSYPQVFRQGDHIYLLPEAANGGCVRLYRAVTFPERWEPDRVLIENFAGADPTIFFHKQRWWMLAGDHHDQDETKLFAFFSDDLFGPWQAHPMNPVKSDLASARPAGAPFIHQGKLLRPAQVGTASYGGAVAINHITHLTPDVFVEETIATIHPDPGCRYPSGLHTWNGCNGMTLVDGKRHRWSWRCFRYNLSRLGGEILSRGAIH